MLKVGDTVKVHYTGSYMDDTVFDTTITSDPIQFTIGDEMMIPAFEKAVISMQIGEKKSITLKAKDAYGEYDEDLLMEVDRKEVFGDKDIKVKDIIQVPTDDGVMVFKVHEIGDKTVILDGNLEMAGKDVKFDIELIAVMDATNTDIDDELFGDIDDELDDDLEIDEDFNIEEY